MISYFSGSFKLTDHVVPFYFNGVLINQPSQSTPIESSYKKFSYGAGLSLGYQYFLGKQKKIAFDHTLSLNAYKNILLSESNPINYKYDLINTKDILPLPELWFTISYTFVKTKVYRFNHIRTE